MYILLF